MLGNTERRVLGAYCSDHAAATCDACRRDYKFTELGVDIGGRRYFCPTCRLDLADQLQLHILHCQGIAAALDDRIERSEQLMRKSDRLRTASAILAAESHALAERALRTLRDRQRPVARRVPTPVPAPDLHRVLIVLLEVYGPVCKPCLAHHARMPLSKVAVTLDHLRQTIALRVEHRDCPGCNHITRIFSLAKTHEDAHGRDEPRLADDEPR